MSEIMTLAGTLTDVFYANASSKPPKPVPHWFVGKEVCAFLQGPAEVPNPEEIMTFADFLSASMRVTKKSLDDLLDAGIRIVPGAHEVSTGVASSRDDPTSIDVHVPPLPKSFGDATLVAWHKKPGDMVRRDENIADLETDEVVVEVTAPANGVMGEQKVATGITVTGGQVIAVISRF